MTFEFHTVDTHLRAWFRWERWCRTTSIDPGKSCRTVVMKFIDSTAAATRPRLYEQLTWLRRELHAPLATDTIAKPRHDRNQIRGAPNQASLPTPDVLKALLQCFGNEKAQIYVESVHMCRLGLLRWKHCQRSVLLSLDEHTITGSCLRSKAKIGGK